MKNYFNHIKSDRHQAYKESLYSKIIITAFVILAGGFWFLLSDTGSVAAAADNQVSVTVDYLEETATVKSVSGASTKFYFSTDNKKTWEVIDSNGIIDISVLLQKKPVLIYFKGNKEINPLEVALQAEDATMKASYQVLNGGIGAVAITGTNLPVEYRKGSNGQWKTVNSTIYTAIYETKGATLYFRTVATTARRAGAVVTVKIPKRPSAPSVKLDGSKLQITGLKNGETLYRVNDSSVWIPFAPGNTSIKTLDLAALLSPTGAPANTPISAGVIEFRTKETDKKVASSIKVIEIPAQPVIPNNNVQLNGTTLSIQDTDLKKVYEYTTVEKSGTLNILTARWSTITAARPVIIPKLSVDDKVYVRIKSITDPTTKLIVPASTYIEKFVTSITIK